jgi:hypothetical protein
MKGRQSLTGRAIAILEDAVSLRLPSSTAALSSPDTGGRPVGPVRRRRDPTRPIPATEPPVQGVCPGAETGQIITHQPDHVLRARLTALPPDLPQAQPPPAGMGSRATPVCWARSADRGIRSTLFLASPFVRSCSGLPAMYAGLPLVRARSTARSGRAAIRCRAAWTRLKLAREVEALAARGDAHLATMGFRP